MNIKSKFGYLCCASLLTTSLWAQDVLISTRNTSLLLDAPVGGEVRFIYYGDKLSTSDAATLLETEQKTFSAYPVYGLNCPSESALSVTHGDGNMTLQLEVIKVDTRKEQTADITTIRLKDKVYPFYMNLCYRTYPDADIIETWTEITHEEKKAITLNRFASAHLPIRKGDVWVSHLYGSWANEAQLAQEPLRPGIKMIKNKDGIRNSHTAHAEVMISLDGKPKENTGSVIGAALCYSGNYKLFFDTDDSDYHHFFAGINEENSAYTLKAKESFRTPELALTYSKDGLSGSSRNFHAWARKHKIANGATARKILLNSWEGVYFDINQEGMDQMMKSFSALGGELFVMDDGWFGNKYSRDRGDSSLGDWTVNKKKLPLGIEGLIASAKKHKIKFGLWIEPEMSNTKSELFEKHPEWILQCKNRPLSTGRGGTQIVLDLTNPEVQDFVFSVIDNLMTHYPEIAYMKWDANSCMLDYGSPYLPKEKQSHLYIEYHRGLNNVLERIRAKYPQLILQACAGGGGRINYGILPYFDEFWTSDDTDALQRVYLQWGVSCFYPAIAMAAHVSADKNHQTGRYLPLKFRFDVAMSGRLGMEMQPEDMTEADKEFTQRAIQAYKGIRPIVQFGDLYRLISPYENKGVASLMYVAPEKDRAVFYAYKMNHFINMTIPNVKMNGLDPQKKYQLIDLTPLSKNKPCSLHNKIISGKILMEKGIALQTLLKNEYSSIALELQEVK
mgnify:CR=1 FL=1